MALGRATSLEVGWGLRHVASEVDRWRELALTIPDVELRADALAAIRQKRANIDGAALFWTLPVTRSRALVRLLVAYEILADYLDCTSERAASAGVSNGLRLHRALIDALDPVSGILDYYAFHPWNDDGGYLKALVDCCRASLANLPSHEAIRPFAKSAAEMAQVLALNHEPNPAYRDRLLEEFARRHFPHSSDLYWFETTGAASAWLTVLALFALAADAATKPSEVQATYDTYLPWVSLTGTMLDSFVDREEDQRQGAHSYISHYRSQSIALERVEGIMTRALGDLLRLPRGERHLVLASCMLAMYLSKDSARTPDTLPATRRLTKAAGPLPSALIPILRAWRVAYGQQSDRDPDLQQAASGLLPKAAPLPATIQTFGFWRDPHGYLTACRERYGPTFSIRAVGMPPMVLVTARDDIKHVLAAPAEILHPGAGASAIAPLVGTGSFMLAEEDAHLRGRRAVLPAFHHSRVQRHAEVVQSIAEAELERWPCDRVVALHPYLRALSLRVILRTIFGHDHRLHRELHQRLLSMLSITGSLALQEAPLRHLAPWRGLWRRFLHERETVDALLYRAIDESIRTGPTDSLVAALSAITESPTSIRDDLMSVIVAGHETTASQLSWAIHLLSHNLPVAQRLTADVDGGDGSYTLATIKEVLRSRSVFLFAIPRIVRKPFKLNGRTITPPAQLAGCIHLLHHDPLLYDNPEQFRPERFIENERPDVWMPWGGGRKRCPGVHLAMLEMQTVLRVVFSRFRVSPAGSAIERARWRSVIVTPGQGGRVVLHRRPALGAAASAPFFAAPYN